jgi:hypothetical protein
MGNIDDLLIFLPGKFEKLGWSDNALLKPNMDGFGGCGIGCLYRSLRFRYKTVGSAWLLYSSDIWRYYTDPTSKVRRLLDSAGMNGSMDEVAHDVRLCFSRTFRLQLSRT